jgi:hypothetical protein
MNSPVQSLAISLGVMQSMRLFLLSSSFLTAHTCHIIVARKVPFDNPQVLDYVRIAYVASQAIALLVYYYASSKVCPYFLFLPYLSPHVSQIKAKNDQTILKYGMLYILGMHFSSLIRCLRIFQSSLQVQWCVKVPLSTMEHNFSPERYFVSA